MNANAGGNYLDITKLLQSKIHEERLIALLILVHKFQSSTADEHKKIFEYYFKNSKKVNNWDLVDLSADKIVGVYLLTRPRVKLYILARSKNIWQRRIAIIATLQFIKHNQFKDTFNIAKILLHDEHDLIHKAVGWMLREVGKRSMEIEEAFLVTTYKQMPRTMLRYAIERFPESRRKQYLRGQI
ncbi:MAG: DNA alkylation repair protein [Patescibacteria group bacterium]